MSSLDSRRPAAAQLTPQQRLALSRRALVRQLNGGEPDAPAPHRALAAGDTDAGDAPHASPGRRHNVWSAMARGVVQRWWRRHPAHAAGQLARPLLEHYARTEPVKLMAAAAATGSLLVLVRPWRLLSATAVIAAVLKTSDVADLVNTLLQKPARPPRQDPP
ncbi:hypothetical protein J2W25_003144 [Variovorax boronicumulans]|uniref:Uncharacterized protein n=1 Tax=Variovorax boronicumulans TaxID=436515 RepID=A0AAW8DXB1_9BURK|nr:hypothetical protein [Variovorax boronicumulans]MDP9878828.1 hypothetical protein [Variovorax boronicumulans]MDP9924112.1 hypothetical protein [Variovorax boronicumulans]